MARPKRKPAKAGRADADGCGLGPRKAELTPDQELPIANGGVVPARPSHAGAVDEDDRDGCGTGSELDVFTTDEELPVAAGGVG